MVIPIPTLPLLRIFITIFEVLYAPFDNPISNLVFDSVLLSSHLPNLNVALIPIRYGISAVAVPAPILHKCKTSAELLRPPSVLDGLFRLVIVKGATLWSNVLSVTILFIVNIEDLLLRIFVPTPNLKSVLFQNNLSVCPIAVVELANNNPPFVKIARPVPPFTTGNVPEALLTLIAPEIVPEAVIFPPTCNATSGLGLFIPTLPSLRIVITLIEVASYASCANPISNFVLDVVALRSHFVNLKVALIPVFKSDAAPPTLHKCKTSLLSSKLGRIVWLVIVNGAPLWSKMLALVVSVIVLLIVNDDTGSALLIPTLPWL